MGNKAQAYPVIILSLGLYSVRMPQSETEVKLEWAIPSLSARLHGEMLN
jgi:hypothetical protein